MFCTVRLLTRSTVRWQLCKSLHLNILGIIISKRAEKISKKQAFHEKLWIHYIKTGNEWAIDSIYKRQTHDFYLWNGRFEADDLKQTIPIHCDRRMHSLVETINLTQSFHLLWSFFVCLWLYRILSAFSTYSYCCSVIQCHHRCVLEVNQT